MGQETDVDQSLSPLGCGRRSVPFILLCPHQYHNLCLRAVLSCQNMVAPAIEDLLVAFATMGGSEIRHDASRSVLLWVIATTAMPFTIC